MKENRGGDWPSYKVHDHFMLRVPWLPTSVLKDLSGSTSPANLLRGYYSDDYLQEAIFLASPGLYRRMEEWLQGGPEAKLPEKLAFSLSKYLIRMSSRCTPFGRFAGICAGYFGNKTKIRLGSDTQHQLYLRPDMQFLCSLGEKMMQDKELRSRLQYFPNSSLVRLGNFFHYIEYKADDDAYRKYSLQRAECSAEFLEVLEQAGSGKRIDELASLLTGEGISMAEARAYLHQLIDNQVLVAELEPMLSGDGYLKRLQEFAPGGMKPYPLLEELNTIAEDMQEYRVQAKKHNKVSLNILLQKGRSTGIAFREQSFVQGDLKMHTHECCLEESIRKDLEALIPQLKKLCQYKESSLLDRFRESFYRRYEEEEVPLLLALDPEAGPGYLPGDRKADDSALLEGLNLPFSKTADTEIPWSGRDRFLFRKLQQALISGSYSVEVSLEEIAALPDAGHSLPLSFSALARILGKWEKDPGKRLIQLHTVGGNTAGRLAGRFAYLDGGMQKNLQQLCEKEQAMAGDEILAEIIHLPQQRTGNVLMRPLLRKYEIPYLGQAAVDPEFRISPGDLMLSLREDRFRLRSKTLDKFILPRLTNAHNYMQGSLSVYRFLCDLQMQGVQGYLGFNWGHIEEEMIFLPRLCFRNFILKRATWNLDRTMFSGLLYARDDAGLQKAAIALRSRYGIPAEVSLAISDNELWLDLENIHCLRLLQAEAGGMDSLQLHEFIPDGSGAVVSSEKGAYANEFVFFISREK